MPGEVACPTLLPEGSAFLMLEILGRGRRRETEREREKRKRRRREKKGGGERRA